MALNNDEKIIFLANIVALARVDEQLSTHEVDAIVIEKIQKEIGAKKTDLKKAYEKAEQSNYTPTPIGFWSACGAIIFFPVGLIPIGCFIKIAYFLNPINN